MLLGYSCQGNSEKKMLRAWALLGADCQTVEMLTSLFIRPRPCLFYKRVGNDRDEWTLVTQFKWLLNVPLLLFQLGNYCLLPAWFPLKLTYMYIILYTTSSDDTRPLLYHLQKVRDHRLSAPCTSCWGRPLPTACAIDFIYIKVTVTREDFSNANELHTHHKWQSELPFSPIKCYDIQTEWEGRHSESHHVALIF